MDLSFSVFPDFFRFGNKTYSFQVLCSCFAGVYNEFLLKKSGADVDIYVQNVFMYFDSIICNLLVLLYEADYDSVFSDEAIQAIFQYKVTKYTYINALRQSLNFLFFSSCHSLAFFLI